MEKRMNMPQLEPEAYKLLMGLEKYLTTTEVTPIHKELIKTRASQINGCAFCLDMHTKDARKYGETEQRLYTLSTWRETPYFSAEEKAILSLTEEVTLIANHVSDKTYNEAVALLGEKYIAQVIMVIITINAWNRFAITTGLMPQ